MTTTFNLLDQAWFPVDGRAMGLREVLDRAHELRAVTGETPAITASLYRLLFALAQRVTKVGSPDDWVGHWQAGRFGPDLHTYLAAWAERFDLFGLYHPFYQDAYVSAYREGTSINRLPLHSASGDNTTLLDSHQDDQTSISFAEAARNLVAVQVMSPGGLSGYKHDKSFASAPWCFKTPVILLGDSLYQTILLNLFPPRLFETGSQSEIPDAPCWELVNPFAPRQHPYGLLDWLTWMPRRVMLMPDDEGQLSEVTWIPGQKVEKFNDPYILLADKGQKPLRADLGSDLWRKLVANLLDPANQPLNLRWVESLSREGFLNKSAVTLGFYALAGFQARIDGQVIESLRWPLDAPGQQALAAALELAQAGYDALYRTAWSQAMYSHKDREAAKSKVASWGLADRYWGRLRVEWAMLPDLGLEGWKQAIHDAARDEIGAITPARRKQMVVGWLMEKLNGEPAGVAS